MPDRYDEQLSPELQPVASRLRAERAMADPQQLDRVKRRVMARNEQGQRRSTFMKQRIATLLTILGLIAATGGGIAVAGSGGSTAAQGGASTGQYCAHKAKGKCKVHKKKHHKAKHHKAHHHKKPTFTG